MFADYRVPQILSTMGCIYYSPTLNEVVKENKIIESGSSWEVQLRGKMALFNLGPGFMADRLCSLQHLVRGAHSKRH